MKSVVPKNTWISPKIAIRQSQIGGKGMFTLEDIMEREKIVIWGGDWTL